MRVIGLDSPCPWRFLPFLSKWHIPGSLPSSVFVIIPREVLKSQTTTWWFSPFFFQRNLFFLYPACCWLPSFSNVKLQAATILLRAGSEMLWQEARLPPHLPAGVVRSAEGLRQCSSAYQSLTDAERWLLRCVIEIILDLWWYLSQVSSDIHSMRIKKGKKKIVPLSVLSLFIWQFASREGTSRWENGVETGSEWCIRFWLMPCESLER